MHSDSLFDELISFNYIKFINYKDIVHDGYNMGNFMVKSGKKFRSSVEVEAEVEVQ